VAKLKEAEDSKRKGVLLGAVGAVILAAGALYLFSDGKSASSSDLSNSPSMLKVKDEVQIAVFEKVAQIKIVEEHTVAEEMVRRNSFNTYMNEEDTASEEDTSEVDLLEKTTVKAFNKGGMTMKVEFERVEDDLNKGTVDNDIKSKNEVMDLVDDQLPLIEEDQQEMTQNSKL